MVVVTVAGSQVERDVDPPSVVRERLEAFAGEVLAEAMNRPVQVVNGGLYLRGLLERGLRKSLEPLVSRLGGDADYQSMQQFLADSPWDPALVVRAVAERVAGEIEVAAWVLDDTGFPKDGKDSPGVKRQYSGTLGKIGNGQIGVSVHAVGKAGTVPLGWALYLPEEWCEDSERRRKAKIPDEVQFKTKFELGAELVERASGWAVTKAPVLGDHDYGRRVWLRERLDQAGCEYVLSVGPDAKVFEQGTSFRVPPRTTKSGPAPKRPQPDREPQPLGELIARLGQGSAQTVTFRDGPAGEPVTSTFILTRVHAAHGWHARREDQRGPRGRSTSSRPRPIASPTRIPVTAIRPINVRVVAACSSPRNCRVARITRSISAEVNRNGIGRSRRAGNSPLAGTSDAGWIVCRWRANCRTIESRSHQ